MKTVVKTKGGIHNPSLRCHEEVMSKCSSYAAQDVGELACCNMNYATARLKKSKKLLNGERLGKPSKKGVNVKFQDKSNRPPTTNASASVINGDQHYLRPESLKSKSAPLKIKSSNLEESVDFYPVKLKMGHDIKQRSQDCLKSNQCSKLNFNNKVSRCDRRTWDSLLRDDDECLNRNKDDKQLKHEINNQTKETQLDKQTELCSLFQSIRKRDVGKLSDNNFNFESIHLKDACASDPGSTLDFLIRQLKDKLTNQSQYEDLQKIICGIESTISKIFCDNQKYTKKEKSLLCSLIPTSNTELKSDSSESCSKSDSHNTNLEKHYQSQLKESCMYLQSLCMKRRESCRNNIEEKEQLALQLAESRRLLTIAKSKETDYEVKMGELRLKLQEADSKISKQQDSIKTLNESISRLRKENEVVQSLKDSAIKLNLTLKSITSEKDILQSKLCLKELEIGKLRCLLKAKENLFPTTVHKKTEEHTNLEFNLDLTAEEKDISSLSLSTATTWSQENAVIACSSQASSSPRRSPSPYNSWQHISSICQQAAAAAELNKDIADIFQNLKTKTDINNPPNLGLDLISSNNSFWSDKEEEVC